MIDVCGVLRRGHVGDAVVWARHVCGEVVVVMRDGDVYGMPEDAGLEIND